MRVPAVLLALLMAGVSVALTPEDCTFYAPFDGSFDAAQAAGSPKATVQGAIKFVEGLRGQGILVGGPDTRVTYETKGNMDLEAGTVAVWVKPETWNDSDAAMRFFFTVTEGNPNSPADGGTFLWLYRYFSRSTYFLVWDSRSYPTLSGQVPFAYDVPDVFTKGKWTHLAGTWNGDEINLYINGRPQGSTRVCTTRILRSLASGFTIGDANRANAADTVIDEVRIFRRALTRPEVAALYNFKLEAEPARIEMTVAPLPGAKKARVEVNALAQKPSEVAGMTAEVTFGAKGDTRAPQRKAITFTDSQHALTEFGTAGLKPGQYHVASRLARKGAVVATAETDFNLKPPPKWLGSTIGITDKVPAPWTPVTLSRKGAEATIECWGPRRIGVGATLFPTSMVTAGEDILAAPIALSGNVNGAPLKAGAVTTTWTSRRPARVDYAATATSGRVTLATSSFVEYDGLLWTTLKLSGKGPLRVSRLTLEFPLRRQAATLMQTGFSAEDAGAVRAWSHRVLGNAQVWLGNEAGGVQCTIPSARNWMNADRSRQIEIRPEADRVVLRLNLVDKETTFAGGAEYSLGLQLTPVRPHPKGWRMWRITPPAGTPGVRFNPFFTEGWDLGSSYPIPKPEWAGIFKNCAAQGEIPTLYLQPTSIWPGMPDYGDFAAEWRINGCTPPPAFDPKASPTTSIPLCARPKSWADYFVTTFCDLMEGPQKDLAWGAIYFDCAMLFGCNNADHGCAYRDEYGVLQTEQRYLEDRDVQRRFYVAVQERWPNKLQFNHQSGLLNMMVLSHAHGMIDGEHLTDWLAPHGFSYKDYLTLDRMRAEYMGHNYGFVPIFLPEFTRAGEGRSEVMTHFLTEAEPAEVLHLVGLLMLHDILPWPAYSSPAPYTHMWAVQDAFGWGDEVEFLPYWANQDMVKVAPADPNIVCTVYRRPGKLMLVVMNNTDEDRDVALAMDAAKLGMPRLAEGSVLDAWQAASFTYDQVGVNPETKQAVALHTTAKVVGKEERVTVSGARFTVKVGKRSFRVLTAP
jgi:hypothetical protein